MDTEPVTAAVADYLAMASDLDELGARTPRDAADERLAAMARFWRDVPARAAAAEARQPASPDRPWCLCARCQQWRLGVAWARMAGRVDVL